LDTEKAFDTIWHLGLLYKLSELKFSIFLIKLISSFLSERVPVVDEMSMQRDIYTRRVTTRFCLFPHIIHHIYKWYAANTCVYLGLFADDTCIYTPDHKEGYVLKKIQ
jgi:hypothetical protein